MIQVKLTWPAAILILVALAVWLFRHQQPPSSTAKVPRRPAGPRPSRRRATDPDSVIIIDAALPRDGHDSAAAPEPEPVSYAEAIRAPLGTYTSADIDAIAARELRDAVRGGLEANRDPHLDDVINKFKLRSYARR